MNTLIRILNKISLKMVQIEKIIRLEIKLVIKYIKMNKQEKINWLKEQTK